MAMTLSQAAYQHNVCFWHKADIARPQPDHFQPASLTRYDARSELGGKQMSRREFIALLGGVASRTML
jgi:hypothetical protein